MLIWRLVLSKVVKDQEILLYVPTKAGTDKECLKRQDIFLEVSYRNHHNQCRK